MPAAHRAGGPRGLLERVVAVLAVAACVHRQRLYQCQRSGSNRDRRAYGARVRAVAHWRSGRGDCTLRVPTYEDGEPLLLHSRSLPGWNRTTQPTFVASALGPLAGRNFASLLGVEPRQRPSEGRARFRRDRERGALAPSRTEARRLEDGSWRPARRARGDPRGSRTLVRRFADDVPRWRIGSRRRSSSLLVAMR